MRASFRGTCIIKLQTCPSQRGAARAQNRRYMPHAHSTRPDEISSVDETRHSYRRHARRRSYHPRRRMMTRLCTVHPGVHTVTRRTGSHRNSKDAGDLACLRGVLRLGTTYVPPPLRPRLACRAPCRAPSARGLPRAASVGAWSRRRVALELFIVRGPTVSLAKDGARQLAHGRVHLQAREGEWRSSGAPRHHSRSSEVIRGHQRSSEVISHQWRHAIIRGCTQRGGTPPARTQSDAIRGNPRPSEAIIQDAACTEAGDRREIDARTCLPTAAGRW